METRHSPTAATAPATPGLGYYEIDVRHCAVTFRTRHLFGLAPVRGAFSIRSGTVDVAEPLAASAVHAEIDAASFRTGNAQRDASVRSARMLDAARHPVITFDVDRIDGTVLAGVLTVRGVTRPVSLMVEHTSVSPGSFLATARVRIDRTEFGITAARGLAGRYLDLSVEVQCVRK
jgi:polyisoprenoid-binding protein YceI